MSGLLPRQPQNSNPFYGAITCASLTSQSFVQAPSGIFGSLSGNFNGKLDDVKTYWVNDADNTKQLFWSLGGQTTSTNLTLATQNTTSKTITFPDITDTIVTKNTVDNLKNKSIDSLNCNFYDNTDATKQLNFNLASAGHTSVCSIVSLLASSASISIPNTSGLNDSFLLTNLGALVSNKSLVDANVDFVNTLDNSKALKFSLGSAVASTILTVVDNQSTSQSLSIPDVSSGDSFVTLNTTQTLTNKTLTTPNIIGVTDDSNSASGSVGEYFIQSELQANEIALTSGMTSNVFLISNAIPSGDWDLYGTVIFDANGSTTSSSLIAGLSLVSATLPTPAADNNYNAMNITFTAGQQCVLPVGPIRANSSSAQHIFLVAQATFAISTMSVYGCLTGRRIR